MDDEFPYWDQFEFYADDLIDNVHIIESPSRDDIANKRYEGKTLKDALFLEPVINFSAQETAS